MRRRIQADPARDRKALAMHMAGKTVQQIARHLKVSPSRVKQLLARARKAAMAAQGGTASPASGVVGPGAVEPIRGLGMRNGIDLDRVATLRREGMKSASDIARVLGLPPQMLLGQENGEAVKEALAVGVAFADLDSLRRYHAAMAEGKGQLTGLAIFERKQYGWTDRQIADAVLEINAGVRDRISAAADVLRAKWASEGRSA